MVFPAYSMNMELVVATDLSDMAAARAAFYTLRSTQCCQHPQPSIDTLVKNELWFDL